MVLVEDVTGNPNESTSSGSSSSNTNQQSNTTTPIGIKVNLLKIRWTYFIQNSFFKGIYNSRQNFICVIFNKIFQHYLHNCFFDSNIWVIFFNSLTGHEYLFTNFMNKSINST